MGPGVQTLGQRVRLPGLYAKHRNCIQLCPARYEAVEPCPGVVNFKAARPLPTTNFDCSTRVRFGTAVVHELIEARHDRGLLCGKGSPLQVLECRTAAWWGSSATSVCGLCMDNGDALRGMHYNGNYGAYQKPRSWTCVTVFGVFTFVV